MDVESREQNWREHLGKPGSLAESVTEDGKIAHDTRESFAVTVEVFRVIYARNFSARFRIRERRPTEDEHVASYTNEMRIERQSSRKIKGYLPNRPIVPSVFFPTFSGSNVIY